MDSTGFGGRVPGKGQQSRNNNAQSQNAANTGGSLHHARVSTMDLSTSQLNDQTPDNSHERNNVGSTRQLILPHERVGSAEARASRPRSQIHHEVLGRQSTENTQRLLPHQRVHRVEAHIPADSGTVQPEPLQEWNVISRDSLEQETTLDSSQARVRLATTGKTNSTPGIRPGVVAASRPATGEEQRAETKNDLIHSSTDIKIGGDMILRPRGSRDSGHCIQRHLEQDMDGTQQREKRVAEPSTAGEPNEFFLKRNPHYYSDWIRDAHRVQTTFLTEGVVKYMHCDIDTYTGVPMEPIAYPVTEPQLERPYNQINMTSEYLVKEFVAAQNIAKSQMQSQQQAIAVASALPAPEVQPPNTHQVKIPCHLRPAVELDIPGIQTVYNHETLLGYRAMDINPITLMEFVEIYKESVNQKTPFIVAVEGRYEPASGEQNVLGFGLIVPVNRGLSGAVETRSQRTGRLIVVVKPRYRCKGIGTALFDILMASCSGRYSSKGGYEFVNPTSDWPSTKVEKNPHKWWSLEVDLFIRSKEDEEKTREGSEFKWATEYFEVGFFLLLQNYDARCQYDAGRKMWLDKATFRHYCRSFN